MSDKKLTIEELTKQCEEAKKTFDLLNEQLQKQKKEEEDRKQAELAVQKDARHKEVEDAFNNYQKLLRAFIRDYGWISINHKADDWFGFLNDKFSWLP